MATSWSTAKGNIRLLTGDLNPDHYAIDSDRLKAIADSMLQQFASRAGMGVAWVTGASALAISDTGSADFTLPTSVQFDRVVELALASTNRPLERLSLDLVDRMLLATSPQTAGDPWVYALFESVAQSVTARFYPRPNRADTVNILRSQVPNAITSDIISIPFSDPLMRGFEAAVAGACVALMDQEEMARLKLTKTAAEKFVADGELAIKAERKRKARLSHTDQIVVGTRGY